MFEGYTPSIGTTNVYPNDSTLSGTPYGVISFTNKGYTISASSCQRGGGLWNEYKANHPYLMFDNLNATMWNCGANNATLTMDSSITNTTIHSATNEPAATSYVNTPYYNNTNPNAPYRGGNATNQYYRIFYDATFVDGEWFQLQFPKIFQINSFETKGGSSSARMPYKMYILGSQNGSTWTLVNIASNPSLTVQTWNYTIPNTKYYLYYRFVITHTTNRMVDNTAPVNGFQGHVQSSNFKITGYFE